MKSEEYLLLAEIDYWREMIDEKRKFLSSRAIKDMNRCLARATWKLTHLRAGNAYLREA